VNFNSLAQSQPGHWLGPVTGLGWLGPAQPSPAQPMWAGSGPAQPKKNKKIKKVKKYKKCVCMNKKIT